MAEIKKTCKHCGYMTTEKICPSCEKNGFADKHKGKALVFDTKTSIVGEKVNAKIKGQYALKFN